MIKRRFSGELRYKREVMRAWIVTDLPEPVAPAMRACGDFAKLAKRALPVISLPSDIMSGLSELWNSCDPRRVARPTVVFAVFGTSIPTRDLPGIGASIRIG